MTSIKERAAALNLAEKLCVRPQGEFIKHALCWRYCSTRDNVRVHSYLLLSWTTVYQLIHVIQRLTTGTPNPIVCDNIGLI